MRTRWLRYLLIGTGLLLVFGCAPAPLLRPAPEAQSIGAPTQAVAEQAGVQLEIDTDAWRGMPSPLSSVLPIQIRIENQSTDPVHVEATRITLRFEDGQERPASTPEEIDAIERIDPGLASRSTWLVDRFPMGSDALYPHYRPLGLGPEVGGAPLVVDDPWRTPDVAHFQVELPTTDMLQRALDAETLEPGESTRGFVYFEDVPADAERADLIAEVSGRTLMIPLTK